MYRNKSSIVVLDAKEGIRMETLSWTDHPYCLPDFKNGVEFSLPFLITHLRFGFALLLHLWGRILTSPLFSTMIVGLLKVSKGDSTDVDTQKKIDEQVCGRVFRMHGVLHSSARCLCKISKVEKWNALSRRVRDERQAIFQELRFISESKDSKELFQLSVSCLVLSKMPPLLTK